MTNSPPPGSEGPLQRLLESLNRLGERLKNVVAAAFPNDADRSFLSGTEEELSESELGEGQSSSTAEVRGVSTKPVQTQILSFRLTDKQCRQPDDSNQDSTGSGAAGSSASNRRSNLELPQMPVAEAIQQQQHRFGWWQRKSSFRLR